MLLSNRPHTLALQLTFLKANKSVYTPIIIMSEKRKIEATSGAQTSAPVASNEPVSKMSKLLSAAAAGSKEPEPMTQARRKRLEQNRRAARESRRRKKNMVEDLQRSVIFFSKANDALKQRNEELARMLVQAQSKVAAIEKKKKKSKPASSTKTNPIVSQMEKVEDLPQPGVTMQEMKNFQEATRAAMEAAAKGLQGGSVVP